MGLKDYLLLDAALLLEVYVLTMSYQVVVLYYVAGQIEWSVLLGSL